MKFKNPIEALQWFIAHRGGAVTKPDAIERLLGRYDGPQACAADIESFLERFTPKARVFLLQFGVDHRQALKAFQDFRQNEKFISRTLCAFKGHLRSAGYI